MLYSYVVARDYGFAPNPFGAFCTLATCKPDIRRLAQPGDWIVGTGSARKRRRDRLVWTMRVAEGLSFDQYWADPRFQYKKPSMQGSRRDAFGDNIYHLEAGKWQQLDSHHSLANGTPNPRNITVDTRANRVLVGTRFAYWGGEGPIIPGYLRDHDGHDLCIGRGYKRRFPAAMQNAFVGWVESLNAQGYLGRPLDWGPPRPSEPVR